MVVTPDPLAEYTARRDRWRAEQQNLHRLFIRLGNWRLAIGVLTLAMAIFSIARQAFSPWWLLVPIVAFLILMVWHRRVIRRRTFAERAIRFYARGLARLTDNWMGKGNAGDAFRDPAHIYSEDLDVFGKASLFELISIARTVSGEQTLATWLSAPAAVEETISRQQAVQELTKRLDLREDIALLGEDVRAQVHESALATWGSAPPVAIPAAFRILAPMLAVLALTTLLGFLARMFPVTLFAVVLAANVTTIYVLRERVRQISQAAETPAHDLRIFSLLLARLERETFETPRLRELRAALNIEGRPASARIRTLERWVDLLDSSDHLLIRLLQPLVLWREQVAAGLEAWRRRNGEHVARWVRSAADFEALSSLASLKFERPAWTFPSLLEDGPCFDAKALQHPLMSPQQCVPNDLALGTNLRLLIVSGSNMSGKSTLLRSVGLNTVLAFAGGPVAAKELRISPLYVGASVRIVDSLQDNRSRFFAEITRIRDIVALANTHTVLFLLDELLSGTNSHDRRIGASAIVRALVRAGAIGLITTHDLALAEIENDLGASARNIHFDDQIIDGRIEFDYRLRPGIVTHSNALELMRAVGLPVENKTD
jgi:MutS domain V